MREMEREVNTYKEKEGEKERKRFSNTVQIDKEMFSLIAKERNERETKGGR